MVQYQEGTVSSSLVFFVNGKRIQDDQVDPEWTLLYYLRTKLRLCGTKLGCGEGGCGACTVMVSKIDRTSNKIIHLPVNACLAPVCAMHGLAVTTVEGIGSTKTKLHPVQERIAKAHGSQCGFCTPGIVMSMYTLLRNSPKPSMKEMEVAFQGNLCRCTGYRPIIEGFKTFTEKWGILQNGHSLNITNGNGVCGMGDKCCKLQNGTNKEEDEVLFQSSEFTPYHPSQEPIFPPELKLYDKYDKDYAIFKGTNVTWYRPIMLSQLLDLKEKYPNAKIVVGNTEVGVEIKFKQMVYPVIIQPVQIPELVQIQQTSKGVKVGASATLIDTEMFLRQQIKEQPEYKTRIFRGVVEMMNWFAGKQIRSVGALGSNIMTGSPISDMIPVLMAAKATLEFLSNKNGIREVTLDNNFFIGYRKSIIKPDEILFSILIPYTTEWQYFVAYKQARRREDDIAIVNEAVNVSFKRNTNLIEEISFGIGGMSFKTVSAPKTEAKLKGLPWNKSTVDLALETLLEDLPLDPGAPGGMISYRRSLPMSLFFKAFLSISCELRKRLPNIELDQRELSGASGFSSHDYKSSQYFRVAPETQEKTDAVHRPIVHMSAYKQATGEAVYNDDIPMFEGELYCAFVLSTKPHAKIVSIDESEAMAMEGVHGFFSGKDVDKSFKWGSIFHDEEIFYSEKVTSVGQIIGLVVADTQAIAQRAAKKVKVIYEELEPVIISIEDAVKQQSFFESSPIIIRGDVDKVFKEAPHVLEGECRMGGQEHFYFETQSCIVIPKAEDHELEIFSSTQNPSEVSTLVSEALGIPQNKIITRVKRLGGGFGGKESKAAMLAIPIAVAAKILNRPLRCMLDRDEDIVMTGARHPFYYKYKVAFDNDGKILGCDAELYSNAGYSRDLSSSVMDRAITHIDNAYKIPACKVIGTPCKTNLPSNTAFRGFGGPQGMYLAETMVQHIATYLNKDPASVSEINLYKQGDLTHYNQLVENCTLDKCWKECLSTSDYNNRKKRVEEFNRLNKYKKRGLSVIPTKFGIAFGVSFLNQSGALVLIYKDGSVLLSHGGVEMGQGLHTKMIQVASRALGIPVEKIHISETATDKVPNTSATAASTGSDLNGMAIINACDILNKRLKPYKEAKPNATWEEWIKTAYLDKVSLASTGFYKTPDIGHNFQTGEGRLYNYFTFGAACSEVEIDTLTGDHQVLRTDIVMDLGESLNPAIDIGQVEGAFMQGYGLFVLEELLYTPRGETITRGPGTYKIPGFGDIPNEFNVSLLKGVSNPRAVYSSKAVGEPPLFLASSVMFAIKDAIKAARAENNVTGYFRLDAPITSAKIRMACHDNITSKIPEPKPGTFKPWNIVA
ncbi:xanthine dehydrogenase [Diorhabda sublineata]|uniref:xanthine dehydrogenase n=1 Tax=Diorhabda sublineata TaxID=1163346 RepID=UPI0024E11372|nr:xanthine dehydrogenase [Diorhabda sublineata]